VDPFDCKRVVKRSLGKDRKDRAGNRRKRVPKWEELVYTPVVFVRVANKGLTNYGKLKSVQAPEKKGQKTGRNDGLRQRSKKTGIDPGSIPTKLGQARGGGNQGSQRSGWGMANTDQHSLER
jgi:hypothetical protein